MYVGGEVGVAANETLTEAERDFIESAMSRSSSTRRAAVAALMNARTMTGWTTHGHSGADCAVYAYGPYEDEFIGHWQSFELGLLMTDVFGLKEEQDEELAFIEKLFMNGSLKICDPSSKQSYIEWDEHVIYPEGNLLAGQYCVEEWI